MCSIIGWVGGVPTYWKNRAFKKAVQRGRDGIGVWADGQELRTLEEFEPDEYLQVLQADKVVANFRAEPTTEAQSTVDNLQPYGGIVHNGMIANDQDWGEMPIDSMVLPEILENKNICPCELKHLLTMIKGSYALAYFNDFALVLACNYKPIYYKRFPSEQGLAMLFGSTPEIVGKESTMIEPYTVNSFEISSCEHVQEKLPRDQSNKVLVSASAGLDSTTVAYMLKEEGYEVTLAHFLYGCKAEQREVERIKQIAEHGGFDLEFLEMPKVLGGTIVEGEFHKNGVEGTEYAHDWVSARNLLMLSIMTAFAETNGFGYIAFGGNLEEAGAYPDNEQEFGRQFNRILPFATQNGVKIELLQPLATYMKHEIVKIGERVGVPWELTWSCYDDGEQHCGECAPCYMRKTAFSRNGIQDPVFNA